MFDVAPTELIVLGTVALLVIPPKDLPRAMRTAGYWVARARGVARQFRSGFDTMVRDAELAEMEKKWKEENERIMREHPPTRAEAGAGHGLDEQPASSEAAAVMVERPTITGPDAPVQPIPAQPAAAQPEAPAPSAPTPGHAEHPVVVPAGNHAAPAADATAPS